MLSWYIRNYIVITSGICITGCKMPLWRSLIWNLPNSVINVVNFELSSFRGTWWYPLYASIRFWRYVTDSIKRSRCVMCFPYTIFVNGLEIYCSSWCSILFTHSYHSHTPFSRFTIGGLRILPFSISFSDCLYTSSFQ